MLRFAGFVLDQQRAELRGPDGAPIKLRPKTFDMLRLFLAHPGRVLSKPELMAAIWPNVYVGDDSLFQCIKELRTALGDDKRQLIKLVTGRGYLFDAEISEVDAAAPAPSGAPDAQASATAEPASALRSGPHRWRNTALAAVTVLAIVGIAIAVANVRPTAIVARGPATIAVTPIADADNDALATQMAANVTNRLADGLAKIENIRVVMPSTAATPADFVVSGELQKNEQSWTVRARMTEAATGEVRWTASHSVDMAGTDAELQQSRLAAGLGHELALRINALLNPATRTAAAGSALAANGKVVVEQATAYINRTTPERFRAAQAMLEEALAGDPDNVDLEVALAAQLLRGVQMVWYSAADSAAAERRAQSMLQHALRVRPNSVPVHEAYCRFLTATNQFSASLVACARALTFDPWNGIALYHLGLAQLQLGRFEDALATFKQADRFDTPQVSRWTWTLGAGMTYLLMGRAGDSLPWLKRSIAITPGSGRTHILLAAAYEELGQTDEAKAAMAKGLELRPGSNALNVRLPSENASPVFLAAGDRLVALAVTAGLPER